METQLSSPTKLQCSSHARSPSPTYSPRLVPSKSLPNLTELQYFDDEERREPPPDPENPVDIHSYLEEQRLHLESRLGADRLLRAYNMIADYDGEGVAAEYDLLQERICQISLKQNLFNIHKTEDTEDVDCR